MVPDRDRLAMSRALLTEAERAALEGEGDENNRSTYRSRVRQRLPQLAADLEHLREHDPELYTTLLQSIAPDDADERMEMAAAILTAPRED